MKKKIDLPTKICPACQRPFAWRKKWERCWDEVKFCSDRCRLRKPQALRVEAEIPKSTNHKT